MPTTIKFIDLHFIGGGSDKVYHAAVQQDGSGYIVVFAYGRRGSSLAYGTKTSGPVSLEKAEKVYEKLFSEKVGKGYQEKPGVSGNIFGTVSITGTTAVSQTAHIPVKQSCGINPQLCNECTEEEALELLENNGYGLQEKYDGERRTILIVSGMVTGGNKKGEIVPVSHEIAEACRQLGLDVKLDSEDMGAYLAVFGLFEMEGQDLRGKAYIDMYEKLDAVLLCNTSKALQLVPLATTTKQKKELFARLKTEGKEGVVFKRLSGIYSPGAPASGGDHLKFKFRADISCIVLAKNAKRSVQIGVLAAASPAAEVIPVGNVTIPAGKNVPEVGDVIDVKYLYAYRGGALFQPSYRGPRTDVDREECLITRIKYKPEEIAA